MQKHAWVGVLAITPILVAVPVVATPSPLTLAQGLPAPQSPFDDPFLSKAQNIARQIAVRTNGGLSQYRPEPAMFGPSANSPHQKNADGSITFTFKGGAPGTSTPTLESVITVKPDSTSIIDYNGPLRSTLPTSSATPMLQNPAVPVPKAQLPGPSDDAFVTKAQNLARQAAIRANGGLSQYRPEPSMFGPSKQAPYTRNADGGLTFQFKGGTPNSTVLSVESVVTILPDSNVVVNYNGPLR